LQIGLEEAALPHVRALHEGVVPRVYPRFIQTPERLTRPFRVEIFLSAGDGRGGEPATPEERERVLAV
jgi:hypothetical protein